jgi:hypothetical protein
MATDPTMEEYLRDCATARRKLRPPPEGWSYACMEEYVVEAGTNHASEPLTADELEIVLAAVDATRKRFQIKQCFSNGQLLALFDPSGELVYTEGYAVGRSIPMLHGWVTINGKVIDLTWRTKTKRSKGRLRDRIFGVLPDGWQYHGVGFQNDFLRERVLRREGEVWSVIDDWKEEWPALRGFPDSE